MDGRHGRQDEDEEADDYEAGLDWPLHPAGANRVEARRDALGDRGDELHDGHLAWVRQRSVGQCAGRTAAQPGLDLARPVVPELGEHPRGREGGAVGANAVDARQADMQALIARYGGDH